MSSSDDVDSLLRQAQRDLAGLDLPSSSGSSDGMDDDVRYNTRFNGRMGPKGSAAMSKINKSSPVDSDDADAAAAMLSALLGGASGMPQSGRRRAGAGRPRQSANPDNSGQASRPVGHRSSRRRRRVVADYDPDSAKARAKNVEGNSAKTGDAPPVLPPLKVDLDPKQQPSQA